MDAEKKTGYNGYTEARKNANAKYERETVERISLVMPKGKKAIIKAAADAAGESVNQYINGAVDERMKSGGE